VLQCLQACKYYMFRPPTSGLGFESQVPKATDDDGFRSQRTQHAYTYWQGVGAHRGFSTHTCTAPGPVYDLQQVTHTGSAHQRHNTQVHHPPSHMVHHPPSHMYIARPYTWYIARPHTYLSVPRQLARLMSESEMCESRLLGLGHSSGGSSQDDGGQHLWVCTGGAGVVVVVRVT
jgi:hypothetical protein